jgi:23S rRNA pseudouridine1911/1915/1917 synthase
MSTRTVRFEVPVEDAGKRLDQVLAAHVPDLSRRKARVLLDIGGVFVDRARVKVAGRPMRPGQVVEAHLGGALERATKNVGNEARARDAATLPEFTVLFEDRDLIVVDKPAGLLTAPTPESDRGNLGALLEQTRERVFVVHRIDLQTSGLLVFAKTRRANSALAARFRDHDVERAYTAVVAGALAGDAHTITAPVQGRPAVTHVKVLERIGDLATVLDVRLETGRTHQIRIHCRHLGHGVLGEPGPAARTGQGQTPTLPPDLAAPRMALHARVLGFVHPRSGETLRFEQPLPPDLATWLDRLRTAAGTQPAVETPAVETPAVETPAVETPAVETPAVETPTVETPAVEAPATKATAALPDSDG